MSNKVNKGRKTKGLLRWVTVEAGESNKKPTRTIDYMCVNCMNESRLDVCGIPIAQIEQGVVFDIGYRWMPKTIRCPHCKSTLTTAGNGGRAK